MIRELKSMFEKQAGVERFDLIQTFHACKQKDGKPVGAYVLKMKDYVEKLECLGYVVPQDISVGLILNGLTSNFVSFVRNYNMHNMGKTVGELHALLFKYEKGLPKKAATPQVMTIQGGRIQKANKKSLNAKGNGKGKGKGTDKPVYIRKPKNPKPSAKEHPTKDDACHHYKEVGHWKRNCLVYLAELIKKKKQVGTASSSVSKNDVLYFNVIPSNVKHYLDSPYLWHCRLAYISKKRIEKLQHDGLLESTDEEYYEKCVSCLSGKMTRKPFPHRTERATDLLGIIHTDVCGPLRHVSRQVVARYAEFLEKNLISQEVSGRAKELKEIQDKDTSPSEDTSKIPMEVEGFELPQEEVVPIHRSAMTRRAPDRLCLNVEVEEHSASTPKEVKRMQNVPYASAVGSIMYASPREPHWTAVKTILKYLRDTEDMFLVYGRKLKAELRVDYYFDAGFETDRDDIKSQKGYVFNLNGGAVNWKSSKQSTTAMFATEAEYIAASEAAMDAFWIRKFISRLGIVPIINEPIEMLCDKSVALHFPTNRGFKGAPDTTESNVDVLVVLRDKAMIKYLAGAYDTEDVRLLDKSISEYELSKNNIAKIIKETLLPRYSSICISTCLQNDKELLHEQIEEEDAFKVFDALSNRTSNSVKQPLKCVKCNGCMLSDNHDLCVLDFINNVNARAKSRSVKKNSKKKVWKPTGKVFTNIGYIWRPTGRTFTIVGNTCPLTRITTTTEVPLRKSSALDNKTPKPVVTLVYSRKPRKSKTSVPVNNYKVVQIVLWYLDSGYSKHMTGDRSQLTNFVNKFLGIVKFGNDHVSKIMGYGDYHIGNVTISRVYYVEGLGHNLFSVGQFCDSNLEVAFCQHTCYIRNLEGVDLLIGSRGDNLYTLLLGDMMASSPICLLSKASKTKSWLWHRRLSHLNFGAINHLARYGLI
ncbi:integrase, catalytic region, zinc finger, CCHC-type containing protein [Tanacetum coccineum]|uniref:Integrase, catalytic region, zinc finger, CCHC-type containing protein n=1 Tax=Tanacetum coccineum TaxID=301880 RepID=A0ABQ4WD97_9ASTR